MLSLAQLSPSLFFLIFTLEVVIFFRAVFIWEMFFFLEKDIFKGEVKNLSVFLKPILIFALNLHYTHVLPFSFVDALLKGNPYLR